MDSPAVEVESEPEVAASLFGDGIDKARAFTADLAERGETLGLIGPLELPRLWSRHIVNCALPAPLFSGGTSVADIGSGAGLPGVVLAIARPDVSFTLIEPMERRVAWLEEQKSLLSLENVTVVRARAQDATGSFDVVTARAVSAFSKLVPMTVPLTRDGGRLVFMKGANAEAEIAAASKVIARFRLRDVEVSVLGSDLPVEPTRVITAVVP
ncbi:16S rRNA (guanine(527)-N(7))-methyltransferase RsmG [Cnuibacter sp. UC19_7]|uniref:16S rRNA (guanine(527)-N(7))-methyltransferase RsmG n=1 Tax=Cnuibacter sp. UC19_7 TaxID=3350166 RepID=UPI00366E6847